MMRAVVHHYTDDDSQPNWTRGFRRFLGWPLKTACGLPSIGNPFFPLACQCQSCLLPALAALGLTAQLQSIQQQLQLHPQTDPIYVHFLLDLSHLHALRRE